MIIMKNDEANRLVYSEQVLSMEGWYPIKLLTPESKFLIQFPPTLSTQIFVI